MGGLIFHNRTEFFKFSLIPLVLTGTFILARQDENVFIKAEH